MTQKTVVVAIDATDVQDRFTVALQGAGHRAVNVRRPDELVEVLTDRPSGVDLVVLDTGFEDESLRVVRTLRQVAPDVPVIVFSGSIPSAGDIRELAALGVTSFVNEHIAVPRILPSLAPLLFPDSFDRRTSARVTLSIAAALRSGDAIAAVGTLNIGKGGIGVRAMTTLETGTKVTVRFRLPRSQPDIEAVSRVVWSDPQSALGLQFEEVETPDQSAVDEFVDYNALP